MARDDEGTPTLKIILLASLLLAVVVGVFVFVQHHAASSPPGAAARRPPMSAEQKAALASFTFADLHMSAAVNFLGDTVTYLDGTVTNHNAKPVRSLEVELNFVDTLNQVVLRENAHPLADRTTPLQPGETYAFRLTFDHMPMDWNQAPPSVKPVYVDF